MKRQFNLLIMTLALSFLYGCASVQIYSDAGLKSSSGLKFYTAKPYLLVEYKSAKDMTIKTSVIYLPDLANPQYLKVKPGIGSTELKMAFSDGILTSYGLTTEAKAAETINSIASLLAKSSDAVKQLGVPGISPEQNAEEPVFVLYEIVITSEGTELKEIMRK